MVAKLNSLEKKGTKGPSSEEIENSMIDLHDAVNKISINLNKLISEYSGENQEKPEPRESNADEPQPDRRSLMYVIKETPDDIRRVAKKKIYEIDTQVHYLREILM